MSNKKKILFFIESLGGGGAENILSILANHIDKEKFDITVSSLVAGVHASRINETVRYIPIIKTKNKLLYSLLYNLIYRIIPARWVYILFLPKGNDIEIAFCEGFATKLIADSLCKRKIAWVHIDLISNPWTQEGVYTSVIQEKHTYEKFNQVVCVSDAVKESFEKKFGIPAKTIYNPIDRDNILALSKEEKKIPFKKRIRFVTMGRLVHQKAYDRLLKVMKQLHDEGYDFELWILGEGMEREKLQTYIEENDMRDYVKLWGFISNPYPYVASGDVFVCSSKSEGYSTAVTEALILGIPVITTLCAGMEELLGKKNEYGCIVANEDDALLEPLRKVLSSPSYLEQLKQQAEKRGEDFKIEYLIAHIENVLE